MTDGVHVEVAIVETHALLREAFRALLEGSKNITVVGEAAGGNDVLDMLTQTRPDVVVMVMDGGGEFEVSLLQYLPDIAEHSQALLVTPLADVSLHAQAIELGARGVVMKHEPAQVLIKAIEKIHAGEIWLDRARTAGLVNRLTRRHFDEDPEAARIDSLTQRERQIVELVTEGLTNKDISQRLFISEATARNHVTSILDKLGLPDRFQLTVYAFRRGLVLCPHTPAMLRVAACMTADHQRVRDRVSHGRKA